jgi:hypothetical protein
MDKYNFPATAFLITETLWNNSAYTGYLSLAQAQELEWYSGWEMATHAYTAANHNSGYVAIGQAAALADAQAAKNYLRANGFRSPEMHAYPLGLYNAGTLANTSSLFCAARSLTSKASGPAETVPPADLRRLRTVALGDTTVLSTIEGYVAQAAANREWLILTCHDIQATASTALQFSTANFQSLMDYINATGMPVMTVSDVLKKTGLPVSSGLLAAPSVPATTVALTNPYYQPATIYITAGASTCAVALNGTSVLTIALTGTGTVRVGSGQTVTLTYSSAPTWAWFGA